MSLQRLKITMVAFRRDQGGSASVESLLWVPIFVYFLMLVLDVSLIFHGKAQALQIVQDGNRKLSLGNFTGADDSELETATETYIAAALATHSSNATVDATIDAATSIVTTTALIPASDLMAVRSLPIFGSTTIEVTAQHYLER